MKREQCLHWAWLGLITLMALPGFGAGQLEERAAQIGEWDFRPDGETVSVNPPGFSWRPCAGARGYAIQVARDAKFKRANSGDTILNYCEEAGFPIRE